jgi:tetratricopeptide (TPR) repeat protein
MVRRIFCIVLLTGLLVQLQAENVFIETYPSGASVFFDGKLLEEKTPLKLEDIKPGSYSVKIVKKDFGIIETDLAVEEGKTALLVQTLQSDYIIQRFTGEDRIVFDGAVQENRDQIFRIPEGTYKIKRTDGLINVKPVYEYDWAVKAMLVIAPAFALATVGMVVQDLVENGGDNRFSATTIAGITLTTASAGLLAGLLINQKRFHDTLPFGPADPPANDEVALGYYDKGEEALAAGNFSEAQMWYLRLLQNQPESRYYPHALYKMAKIHYLSGDDALALAELKLLEDKYPTSELYDKICKTMADILYRGGGYSEALEYLEKMEYIDPLYSRDEIKRYMDTIRELIN